MVAEVGAGPACEAWTAHRGLRYMREVGAVRCRVSTYLNLLTALMIDACGLCSLPNSSMLEFHRDMGGAIRAMWLLAAMRATFDLQ